MDKKIIIACLLLWVTTASCGQNREYSGDEAKALQVAKEFTEAIYHGEYDRAKSHSSTVNRGQQMPGIFEIADVSSQIEQQCIIQKKCPVQDADWRFELLEIKSVPIAKNNGGMMPRFRIFFTCKQGYYNLIDVTKARESTFLVTRAFLKFEEFCDSSISDLNH